MSALMIERNNLQKYCHLTSANNLDNVILSDRAQLSKCCQLCLVQQR